MKQYIDYLEEKNEIIHHLSHGSHVVIVSPEHFSQANLINEAIQLWVTKEECSGSVIV